MTMLSHCALQNKQWQMSCATPIFMTRVDKVNVLRHRVSLILIA